MENTYFPVQTTSQVVKINTKIAMLAYEVYAEVYGPQPALITGNYRGGFATSELIVFLYARNFPKQEWKLRIDEAMSGMETT